jgi:hypothetical protein
MYIFCIGGKQTEQEWKCNNIYWKTVIHNRIIQHEVKQCNCQGEQTRVKETPLYRRGIHPFPVKGLKQKTQKKNNSLQFTLWTSCWLTTDTAFRRVLKQDLEKQTKRNAHRRMASLRGQSSVLPFAISISGITSMVLRSVMCSLYVNNFTIYYKSQSLPAIEQQLKLTIDQLS